MNSNNFLAKKTKRDLSSYQPEPDQVFEANCVLGGGKYVRILGEEFYGNNWDSVRLYLNGTEIPYTNGIERLADQVYNLRIVVRKKIIYDLSYMFASCKNYLKISLAGETKNLGNINGMFYNCISLSVLEGLKDLDLSSLVFCGNAFYGCASLNFIPGIEKIRFGSVSSWGIFGECSSLVWLNTDLKHLSDGSVEGCVSLLNKKENEDFWPF